MSDSDLDKTEQPTSKRIEKAREEGNVPRSRELSTCTVLLAAGVGMWMFGSRMNTSMKSNLASGLTLTREMAYDTDLLITGISSQVVDIFVAFTPLAGLLFAVAVFSPALIGGWNFSTKSLGFKASRMNPAKGLGNMFSSNSVVELVKSILKAAVVGSIGYMVITSEFSEMLALTVMPVERGLAEVADILIKSFLMIVGSLVLIAAIDVPFQLYQYTKKLKMSKQEIKQEHKESEGSPEIKAKIRQLQREMAKNRMMADVPTATVVITNPTHYAVAVKYSEESSGAPVVVAKGADAIALKIKEVAKESNVIQLESPKLARALFTHTEIGDQIPEALYSAVAEVLAYVFHLNSFHKRGGEYPNQPSNLNVPDEMDPHFVAAGAK